MTNRITLADLNAVIARINRETKSPAEPYAQDADGKHHAQIGCYHLSRAYGGYALHRMSNESGGLRDVFSSGHTTARTLYDQCHAFLRGLDAARGE